MQARTMREAVCFVVYRRGFFLWASLLCLVMAMGVVTWREAGADKGKAAQDTKAEKKAWYKDITKISGLYTIWGLNQHGFLLGRDHPLDNADYAVQMLRLKLRFGTPYFGVRARLDGAQGWWGANNNPNIIERAGQDATGNITNTATYNPYALFRNKDTNYDVHFDRAYLYLQLPWIGFPLRVTAGRQYFSVGNKLVLDQGYDGVILSTRPVKLLKIDLMWARVSEGKDSFRFPKGLLMSSDGPYQSADLLGGRVWLLFAKHKLELYGLFYQDNAANPDGSKDWTLLPQGVGYNRARFTPNLSQVIAFGVNARGTFPVLAGLHYNIEASYLIGKDEVANTNHAGGLLDINDGNLSGFNLYAKLTQKANVGIPLDASLTFGLGSGDNDPTSGPGNINKIQTMGFFSFTNVWEDSVMPDVEGISPQGLGSPVSRGYREFENTIAVQIKLGAWLAKFLRIEASYSYMQAFAPIRGFDSTGTPTAESASDIGMEIDANIIIKLFRGRFIYKTLFGVFLPGKAAGLLINGNTNNLSPAWEFKHVAVVKF